MSTSSCGPSGRGSLAEWLREARPEGVLSLLPWDERPLQGHPAVRGGLASSVWLVQAMVDAGCAVPLWTATRGAVSVMRSEVVRRPAQAACLGLMRTVALEHPELRSGLVDLPDEPDEPTVRRLLTVLAGATEDEVALRTRGLYARRLTRATAGVHAPWSADGPALITGGTGAVGQQLARWAARRGASPVVLLSRRGPDAPGVAALRDELSAVGCELRIEAADVSDRESLAAAPGRLRGDGVAPRLVLHAAGQLPTGRVMELDVATLEQALAAKLRGAELLAELLADDPLQAFVAVGSVAGLWGAGGMGAYAAANAGLAGLMAKLRSTGVPATAVAWGAWAGRGMSSGPLGDAFHA